MNNYPGDSEFVEPAFTPEEVGEAGAAYAAEVCVFLGAELPPVLSEQPSSRP